MGKKLTSRSVDHSKWYNELVVKADLAENSAVRGCMVVKPYGYAIWEKMQAELDKKFKETGHDNAYFPLFVPKSMFEAEEKNAEGFAKECAVVTHYRLKNDEEKEGKLKVDPEAKLEEELLEVRVAQKENDYNKIEEELGDLIFSVINLCRFFNVSGENALRKANKKFKKRFHLLESHVSKSEREIEDFSINELNEIWDLIKKD